MITRHQVSAIEAALLRPEVVALIGPAQLCRQWRHNLKIGKNLCKLYHSAQIPSLEALP